MRAKQIAGPLALLAVVAVVAGLGQPAAAQCPLDAVRAGNTCIDRYEASVWRIADTLPNKNSLIAAIRAGTITNASQLAGAQRRGENGDDYGSCTDNGGGAACTKVFAVSIPGVRPSAHMTWFQALAMCRNAGKRLATNQEWQMAALGTPDPGTDNDSTDCNITFDGGGADPTNTGSRGACVSDVGATDMVGNLWEWVADLIDVADGGCVLWSAAFGSDLSCLGGTGSGSQLPGTLVRGGHFESDSDAGVFAASGSVPTAANYNVGFRCAREL